jgi:hypothetical protein
MRSRLALLLLLILPARAGADPAPLVVHLTYDGYASGFRVLSMQSDLVLGTTGYRISMSGHTAGMVGFLYHANWQTWSEGSWSDGGVAPDHFQNVGVFGGQPRRVDMDFIRGNPVLSVLQPPDDGEHLPVPPAVAHDAIDSLSVTALVIRRVAMLGNCKGEAKSFDGRQVSRLALRATGGEDLAPTSRSSWRGPALRCDIDYQVLGGFFRDDTPQSFVDTIWLGNVLPGAPPLPVRMAALTHHLGRTILYLTSATLRDPGTLTAAHQP